jgi:hypothetical protein
MSLLEILSLSLRELMLYKRRLDSSVNIATGYGLDGRGIRVPFPIRVRDFPLFHKVQTGSEAHRASYPVGVGITFPRGKAAGAWSQQHTTV